MDTLFLYNTLTKQKEQFISIQPHHVGLYVCGMTVYDDCHIGHARVWVVFDILTRYLQHIGFSVNYVRNITDIDDKIIQRAEETQQTITSLTQQTIQSMHNDMHALGLLPPTQEPRATHYISEMIALIQKLMTAGYAYQAPSGDIYYAVKKFHAYGELTQQALTSLMSGARVAVDNNKHHPLDFVLWKKADEKDLIYWESPWGIGRPGWHIECSAMALHHLNESFDIHGGGADLKFPHHQNEIAQSEGATQKRFVNTWMHVGFVKINQEKMSKSQGNSLTIKSLLHHYSGEVLRYFLLTSHYRSPINYAEEHLATAKKALQRLYEAVLCADPMIQTPIPTIVSTYEESFYAALNDDLNTPVALSVLFDITHQINKQQKTEGAIHLANLLKKLGKLLGLFQYHSLQELLLTNNREKPDSQWVEIQIQKRQFARMNKQWDIADQIREQLAQTGVIIEDSAEGTRWHWKF